MLKRTMPCAAFVMVLAACSDPDAYPGGGRFETLPGQTGGTLVPTDAGSTPGDNGGAPTDAAVDESDRDASGPADGRGGG